MLTIAPIPAFNDNYHWLIHRDNNEGHHDKRAYIVDPGDHLPVIEALENLDLSLAAIIITHQHYDHVNGIIPLLEHYQTTDDPIPVYGPHSPHIPQITHPLHHGDNIVIFDDIDLHIIAAPGHTPEHIVYFSDNASDTPVLFSGDTLFAAGCGRLLSGGRAEDHYHSLSKIAQLPDDTHVYCAHEYTLANIEFALAVEPSNHHLQLRKVHAQSQRDKQQATIPTTIRLEKTTNPFIRLHTEDVINAINKYWCEEFSTPCEYFTALRRWKDEF